MKEASKKFFRFLASRFFYFALGAFLVSGSVYYALAGTVTNGTPLTPNLWNNVGFHFTGPSNFYAGGGPVGWTTVNATTYGVPADANAIVIQADCAITAPDSGDVDAYIFIGDGTSNRTLLRGRAAGGGDNSAVSGYGVFPLSSSGTFTYNIDPPGFNGGCVLNIVGYFYR